LRPVRAGMFPARKAASAEPGVQQKMLHRLNPHRFLPSISAPRADA
jgi:hypothetical protein